MDKRGPWQVSWFIVNNYCSSTCWTFRVVLTERKGEDKMSEIEISSCRLPQVDDRVKVGEINVGLEEVLEKHFDVDLSLRKPKGTAGKVIEATGIRKVQHDDGITAKYLSSELIIVEN